MLSQREVLQGLHFANVIWSLIVNIRFPGAQIFYLGRIFIKMILREKPGWDISRCHTCCCCMDRRGEISMREEISARCRQNFCVGGGPPAWRSILTESSRCSVKTAHSNTRWLCNLCLLQSHLLRNMVGSSGKWQFVRKSESKFVWKFIVENFRNFSVENFQQ